MLPVPWQVLTNEQRAAAINAVYRAGMTAYEIGKALGKDVTRARIADVYRHVDWLRAEAPLPPAGSATGTVFDSRKLVEPEIAPIRFTQEEADAYDAKSLKMTLLELAPKGDCRFVTSLKPARFCGYDTFGDSPYCEHHHFRCRVAPPQSRTVRKAYR